MATSRQAQTRVEDSVARIGTDYKTLGEMVYDSIREAIVSGRFAPGERLRQEALAEALGSSRIPVRSALIQLESEGLVSFHPRSGAVVRSLTVDQVREIYELRELLESHALRKSMQTMPAERLEQLRSLADSIDAQADGTQFIDARVQFYRALYDAEHSPQLVKLIDELRDAVGAYLLQRRVSRRRHGSHRELVEAVASGDADVAVDWLRQHLTTVRQGVEEIVTAGSSAAKSRTSRATTARATTARAPHRRNGR